MHLLIQFSRMKRKGKISPNLSWHLETTCPCPYCFLNQWGGNYFPLPFGIFISFHSTTQIEFTDGLTLNYLPGPALLSFFRISQIHLGTAPVVTSNVFFLNCSSYFTIQWKCLSCPLTICIHRIFWNSILPIFSMFLVKKLTCMCRYVFYV